MGLKIKTPRDVIVFTISITALSIVGSELSIALLYIFGGPAAFHVTNAMIFAALVPIIIATPISLWVATMSLKLSVTQGELQHLADTDPLTQLPNRRAFFQAAQDCLENQERGGQTCALMVIDADHFKELNDSYGHAAGDQALIAIADVLRENFRASDLICRVGGEEFAILVPDMSLNEAAHLARRVVEKVADSPLLIDNAIIEFSVSCGIADTQSSYDLATLFKTADDAMYVAKRQGRNQVFLRQVA